MTRVERDASPAVRGTEPGVAPSQPAQAPGASHAPSRERWPRITVVRAAAALLCIAALVLTFTDPRFRGAEGELTRTFVAPLSISAMLLLAALFARAGRIAALGWLGLAV
ncbi:MAG: hypothetical protein L0271_14580, partial [Gemmatimonadetes bacterium]|nr:hypothetical protein [Gemmatimonadota bacterium]